MAEYAADEERPLEIILADEMKTERASPANAAEIAAKVPDALKDKLLAIEKIAGGRSPVDAARLAEVAATLKSITDPLHLLRDNSHIMRMVEQDRLWKDSFALGSIEKHMQSLGLTSSMAGFAEQVKRMQENSTFARLSKSMRLMEESSTLARLTESLNSTGALARAAMGPMWELHAAGLLDTPGRNKFESIRKAVEGFESNFRLPALEEAGQLTRLLKESSISEIARRWSQEASRITRAIESIRTPWLDIHNKVRSIAALAELQGLGLALSKIQGAYSGACE